MFGLSTPFRIFCARCLRIVGPYVSERNNNKIKQTPAMMKPTQYVHRQVITETKPDMIGANCGPKAVASQISASRKFSFTETYSHEHRHGPTPSDGIVEDISKYPTNDSYRT